MYILLLAAYEVTLCPIVPLDIAAQRPIKELVDSSICRGNFGRSRVLAFHQRVLGGADRGWFHHYRNGYEIKSS